ncbi:MULTISPECIES: prepilin peptidase [unclassified Microbacterium]|uniref:prepilin peptidase n=1 Tax=unclassified Microbacterium TaxID=2609290 RepID=UPI00288352C2|nr:MULTISPECIES: prepilin peptidase [unclassified Microbacterium]
MLEALATPSGVVTIPTITALVVIVGMFVLAGLDIWRHEVEGYATIILAGVAAAGVTLEGISAQQWVAGLISAALAFTVYLALGIRGVMGGGDVKLAAVPAFVLATINPVLGAWWVGVSLLIQQLFFTAARLSVRRTAGDTRNVTVVMPHVPAMTAGMVIAVSIFPI